MSKQRINSIKVFYPYYLSKHQNTTARILHFIGAGSAIMLFVTGFFFHNTTFFLGMPIVGYGFAWIGQIFFEKSTPSSFKYPLFSLVGGLMLFSDLLGGKQPFNLKDTYK